MTLINSAKRFHARFHAAWLVPLTMFWVAPAAAETWTSLRGTHTVEAQMIGLWGENVVLELSTGRRVTIKLDDLRSESRIQARELAEKLVSSRADRIKELQGQAAAAAAPAPNPLPKPPAAPPYNPPRKDATPVDFLTEVETAVRNGHLIAMYDALPPSYRKDINEIAQLAAQKMNPATWQSLVGTAHEIGDVIVTKQRWFLSSPRVEALPPEQHDVVDKQLLTVAGLLRDGLNPEAMQLDKLKTADFPQWLSERNAAIAPYLSQLFKQYGGIAQRQIKLESEKDGVAVIEIDQDGTKSKVSYTSVEGYWVPKTLADQWTDSVASWKEQLAGESAGAMFETYALMLAPIAPMLDPLAQASSAGEFHAQMEALLVPAETIATSVAAMLGTRTNLASRGSGGEYGMEDYDMEMEGDYEMEMEDDYEMEMEEDYEMENE